MSIKYKYFDIYLYCVDVIDIEMIICRGYV